MYVYISVNSRIYQSCMYHRLWVASWSTFGKFLSSMTKSDRKLTEKRLKTDPLQDLDRSSTIRRGEGLRLRTQIQVSTMNAASQYRPHHGKCLNLFEALPSWIARKRAEYCFETTHTPKGSYSLTGRGSTFPKPLSENFLLSTVLSSL